MSRFGFVFIGYIIYLSVLLIGNSISIANDKPVIAIGLIGKWYIALLVFLIAYISEWISIYFHKEES